MTAQDNLHKRAVQSFLYLIIFCAMACFVAITFMRPTVWYIYDQKWTNIRNSMTINFPGDVPVLTTVVMKDGKSVTKNLGKDAPLWAGGSALPVTLQWGSLLVAALATAGLQQLDKTSGHASGLTVTTTLTGLSAATHAVWRKLRRLAATQIAPVRFWHWWCGGLSVMDAFLVMLWCALTLVYLYMNITRHFASTAVALTPPPAQTSGATAPSASGVDLLTPLFLQRRLENSGKGSGETLRMLLMVMFLPISRSNFMKWLFGTDYATLIKYHRWMSWGTIGIATAHGLLYMVQYGAAGMLDLKFSGHDELSRRNVMGLIALLAGLTIAFTSTTWFRSTYFRLFYRTHICGFLVFVIFAMLHYKNMIIWIMPGLVLYAIDRGFRFWQLSTNWTRVGPENVSIDGSVLTLQLKWQQADGKTIAAGQEVYLRCPAISFTASHPFTASDVKQLDDGTTLLTVHLTIVGPWTIALKNKIQSGCRLRMQVEGPYTTCLDHLPTTPVVVMIAGGIGVTPCLCLLRRFLRQHLAFLSLDVENTDIAPAPKVYFVWSARRLSELKLFGEDLLAACRAGSSLGKSSSCKLPDSDPPKRTSDSSGDLGSTSRPDFANAGWLEAALHYTGFELEQRQNSVEVDMPGTPCGLAIAAGAASQRADSDSFRKDDGSSASGSHIDTPPRLLAAHPASSPALYAICILFGFFGAWAGLLLAAYYDVYLARTTEKGADYLTVGIVQWVCIGAGGIVSPLIVLSIHWASIMCLIPSRQAISVPPAYNSRSNSMSKALGSYLHNTLTVLPGYVLAPLAAKATGEGGISLGRGRPNLAAVLKEVVRQHPDVAEIEVLMAGGDSLAEPVLTICAQHNLSRGKGPALLMKRVAHHA